MTDRDALLTAIRKHPAADVPRLVYADWLDENAECDRDHATAEFVRVACPNRPRKPHTAMPRAAYAWLQANWWRLVPGLCGLHVPYVGTVQVPLFHRRGKWVSAYVRHKWPSVSLYRPHPRSFRLAFARGFLESARWYSRSAALARPRLAADQPLAVLAGPGPDREPPVVSGAYLEV
jgi:uncharacterized protein (TIGR02996 family)